MRWLKRRLELWNRSDAGPGLALSARLFAGKLISTWKITSAVLQIDEGPRFLKQEAKLLWPALPGLYQESAFQDSSASHFQCNAREGQNLGHRPWFQFSKWHQRTEFAQLLLHHRSDEGTEPMGRLGSSKQVSVLAVEPGALGCSKSLKGNGLFKSRTYVSLNI